MHESKKIVAQGSHDTNFQFGEKPYNFDVNPVQVSSVGRNAINSFSSHNQMLNGIIKKIIVSNGESAHISTLIEDSDTLNQDIKVVLLVASRGGHLNIVKSLTTEEKVSISIEAIGEAIVEAAYHGYDDIVSCLLSKREILDEHRGHAVWAASRGGHDAIVECLLPEEVSISKEDRGKAVSVAARCGYDDIVSCLLSKREISQEHRECAVWAAAFDGHHKLIELLIEGGEISGMYIGWAAVVAAKHGHLDVIKYLGKMQEKISDKDKEKAIMAAAGAGHLYIVDYMLCELGVVILGENRETVLSTAAQQGRIDIIEHLLKDKSWISFTTKQQVVEAVAQQGRIDIIEYLLEDKSWLEGKSWILDKIKLQVVVGAAKGGYLNVIKQFFPKNQQVNGKLIGPTILSAAKSGKEDVLEYLFSEELWDQIISDIHTWDSFYLWKEEALWEATCGGHLGVVQSLLIRRDWLDIDKIPEYLIKASDLGHRKILQELLRCGPIDDTTKKSIQENAQNGVLEELKRLTKKDGKWMWVYSQTS